MPRNAVAHLGTLADCALLGLHCFHCTAQCAHFVRGYRRCSPWTHSCRCRRSTLPCLRFHRTSTSPYHKIKPQSEFEARFCLAIVGKPTILKSGSQSAPRKPPLRFGFSSHIGDFTEQCSAYSARRRPKLQFRSVGRGGAASAGTRG